VVFDATFELEDSFEIACPTRLSDSIEQVALEPTSLNRPSGMKGGDECETSKLFKIKDVAAVEVETEPLSALCK